MAVIQGQPRAGDPSLRVRGKRRHRDLRMQATNVDGTGVEWRAIFLWAPCKGRANLISFDFFS
ncbi:hypothetical protein GHT06_014402 [Daphnia sinensis]|uniref:Uncharacterized protein n=1 Tax=Daphnia sinensis TaxID=1820382 RepID=A0AAD5PYV5_9CRUS|nr:hypothetical protein GHT06_014402 [Daphnia sinensis]